MCNRGALIPQSAEAVPFRTIYQVTNSVTTGNTIGLVYTKNNGVPWNMNGAINGVQCVHANMDVKHDHFLVQHDMIQITSYSTMSFQSVAVAKNSNGIAETSVVNAAKPTPSSWAKIKHKKSEDTKFQIVVGM